MDKHKVGWRGKTKVKEHGPKLQQEVVRQIGTIVVGRFATRLGGMHAPLNPQSQFRFSMNST